MRFFKKTTVGFLAAILMLTGCAGGNTSWAFESGDTKIPVGLYIMYQIMALSDAEAKIYEENKDNDDFKAPTKSSDMLKMTVEGENASEWIAKRAEKQVREYIAVKRKFESMGLVLNDAEKDAVDRNTSNVLSQARGFYENNGVSESSLREYYVGNAEKSKLFLELYGESGELAVPEDTLKTYFFETYAQFEMVPLFKYATVPEGETKTVEQLNEELKAEAEGYLKRLQSGEDITELLYEYELKITAEDKKDTVKKSEKKDVTYIITDENRASIGDAITDAVMKAKAGECGIADDSSFYVVFKRTDIMENPETFETYRSGILTELKYEEYNSKIADWSAELQIEPNTAAISKYKPSRLKFPSASSSTAK